MAKRAVVGPIILATFLFLVALNFLPVLVWWEYIVSYLGLLGVSFAALWVLRRRKRVPSQLAPEPGAASRPESAPTFEPTQQPAVRSSGLQGALRKHSLFSYFSIAYAVKCLALIPYTLAAWGVISGNWDLAFVVATFGPLVGGVVMSYVAEGRAGISRLRDGIRKWRVGWWWFLFVFAGIPAAIMLGVLVLPGSLVGFLGVPAIVVLQYPLYYFGVWFGGGGLNEEIGWRGFALPRMQPRYGPLWGTLLLGVLHCFWHIEEFLTPAQGGGPGTGWTPFVVNLPIFFVLVVSFSITATWIFNRTRGSLFAVISAHASVDTPQPVLIPLFPAVGVTSMLLGTAIALGALAVVIVVLTRGRLGYKPVKELRTA